MKRKQKETRIEETSGCDGTEGEETRRDKMTAKGRRGEATRRGKRRGNITTGNKGR